MTAQTLKGAAVAIAGVIAGVSGVESSPAFFKMNISDRIFALNLLQRSDVAISETGTKQHLASYISYILTPTVDVMDEDIQEMVELIDAITTALITQATDAGNMFGGAIDTFENLHIEFINFPYNNIPHTGYSVELQQVKLKLDL